MEPGFWEREDMIGVPILRAKTCDGVVRAQEELPEGWKFVYDRSAKGKLSVQRM